MSDVSPENGRAPDDQTLIRYLTGGMTDVEAEPLDELSVADADFDLRLRAVEHDLVDAYVNGELSGETFERFTSHYLASPEGLSKVEIAASLRGYQRDRAKLVGPAATPAAGPAMPWWRLAAAAVVVLATGSLVVDNLRLRRQAIDVRDHQTALEQRDRQLQEALSRQQSEMAATSQELARARDALASAQAGTPGQPSSGRSLLAFVLLPASRGAADIPTIGLPRTGDAVTLRLQLDGETYSRYEVALTEAIGDRAVWRSSRLRAESSGDRWTLPVTVPAGLLREGAYTAEVIGIPARGQGELLDRYPFRVVLQ